MPRAFFNNANQTISTNSRRIIQAVAVLLTTVLLATGTVTAVSWASTVPLDSVALTVDSDGVAPFDTSDGPGKDASSSNQIVRTHDTIRYIWGFSSQSAGTAQFTHTLTNATWDPVNLSYCQAGSSISTDKRTLTCNLLVNGTGANTHIVYAVVSGSAPNGSLVSGSFSASGLTSNSVELTVSAAPKFNIDTTALFTRRENGPGQYSSVDGFTYDVPIAMWAGVASGTFGQLEGIRGHEAVSSPMTFSLHSVSNAATLVSCSAGAPGGTLVTYPHDLAGAASAAGKTTANSVRNSGTWSCAQSSTGSTTQVTVTGADTSLDSYPTTTATGSSLASSARAYAVVGYVRMWVPRTATTPNAFTMFSTVIEGFDPNSVSGASNFGSSASPNQPGSASHTCVTTGSGANCSQSVVNRVPSALTTSLRLTARNGSPLPDTSVAWDTTGTVTPGMAFNAHVILGTSHGNDADTDPTVCVKWNSSNINFDPSGSIAATLRSVSVPLNQLTVEYGTLPLSTLAQYQAVNCGRPGAPHAFGGTWTSTLPTGADLESVNAVRVTLTGATTEGGDSIELTVPLKARTGVATGTVAGIFSSATQNATSGIASTFDPATAAGNGGNRVTFQGSRVSVGIDWATSDSYPGEDETITVTPAIAANTTAEAVNVTVQLPSPCFSYIANSASVVPAITAPQLGADNLPCTPDDGAGQVLTFNLQTLKSSPQPITFKVNVSTSTATSTTVNATASITSTSDTIVGADQSASDSHAIVPSPLTYSINQQTDTGRVRNGVPYNYTVYMKNHSNASTGSASALLVLPVNGDPRASSALSSLTVNSVTGTAASNALTIEYSTLNTADAYAAALTAPNGSSASFNWTTTMPTNGLTAIRFTDSSMGAGALNSIVLNVTPNNVSAGGNVNTDLFGAASWATTPLSSNADLSIPTMGVSQLTISTASSRSDFTASGQASVFSVTVTNSGTEPLSNIALTGSNWVGTGTMPTLTCPRTGLAAAESMECSLTYSSTQADLDSRSAIEATWTASGKNTTLENVASSPADLDVPITGARSLSLTQSPSTTSVSSAPHTVTYTFVTTNTGSQTISGLQFTSAAVPNGNGSTGTPSCSPSSTSLAPGSSHTCTITYGVTQTDMDSLSSLTFVNAVQGSGPGSTSVTSNSTTSTVNLVHSPALTITKSSNRANFVTGGTDITYSFLVKNTGNVTLTSPTVADDVATFTGSGALSSITCPSTSTLAPNVTMTCTATYRTTATDFMHARVTNAAVAHASFGSQSVSSSPSTVNVDAAGISNLLVADLEADTVTNVIVAAGELITWETTLTNNGTTLLTNLGVDVMSFNGTGPDPVFTCPGGSLQPGESMLCTADYTTTTQDLLTLHEVELSVKGRATTPISGGITSAATEAAVPLDPAGRLEIQVTSSLASFSSAGQVVTFTLRIENVGVLDMSNVAVSPTSTVGFDGFGSLSAISCPSTSLLAGASMNCTATYTVTQDDIDRKDDLTLEAKVVGGYVKRSVSSTYDSELARDGNDLTVLGNAAGLTLNIQKTASAVSISTAGSTITYTFVVTNTGAKTAHHARVRETAFSGTGGSMVSTCSTRAQLLPGQSFSCSAEYITSTGDLKAKKLVNTAIAEASRIETQTQSSVSSSGSTATVMVLSGTADDGGSLAFTGTMTDRITAVALISSGLGLLIVAAVRFRRPIHSKKG